MEYENTNLHSMMTTDFGDEKLSKRNEINESMSIDVSEKGDEYTRAIEKAKPTNGGNE